MAPTNISFGRRVTALNLTIALFFLANLQAVSFASQQQNNPQKDNPQKNNPWYQQAQQKLQQQLKHKPITSKAKNVILFIGDGMSVPTVTAARILQGQQQGQSGEENFLSFEQMPNSALVKTYNVDAQTPDSAGTATALLTGIKTNAGVIGLDQTASTRTCRTSSPIPSTLLELAESAGAASGVVSTARITHATPAAAFAHISSRGWEVDREIPEAIRNNGCQDIAYQLLNTNVGDGIEVMLGGGRRGFFPAGLNDAEYPNKQSAQGRRLDNKNLIALWQKQNPGAQYIWNKRQFDQVKPTVNKLLGLFQPSHMRYEADRAQDFAGEPSLAEMTSTAIDILAGNKNGYFLLVEAGRIDHAHHGGNAARALQDTVAYSDAVNVALNKTRDQDTLIVVTADHSHTLHFAGYQARGNPVLGKVANHKGQPILAADGKPYTSLGYANGPGAVQSERADISQTDTTALNYQQQALVPANSETHGADDVAVYAQGPWAHLIDGVVEQNYLFHVMQYATGW